jgi:demethylspheroidene O-methyltransferase
VSTLVDSPVQDWRDFAAGWRDRLLASAKFRRWAAGFPLTRPIARRRAGALFDLVAGFVYSQVLAAGVRLRLFDTLADGPLTEAELAARLGLPREGTARLLGASVALKLVRPRSGGRFGLGPLGAALVDNPAITEMVLHHNMLYADLADPVALLRGERAERALANYWPYAETDRPADLSDAQVAAYTRLMAASQPLVSGEILDAYDLRRHRRLLDVGGGDGSFLCAAAQRVPKLELTLFDLPAVAARAEARFAAHGLTGRARAVGGDFSRDSLPTGADVISLVRVVHDHDDATVAKILAAARAALPSGGTLLLAEPMAGTSGAEAMGDAYFGLYLLAMGSGRARTPLVLTEFLRAAGFARVRQVATHTPLLTGLLVANRD